MTEALASINQSFEKNYHDIFQEPELIQKYLHQRSKEFDRMIKKEFLQRKLDTDFAFRKIYKIQKYKTVRMDLKSSKTNEKST